MTPAKLAVQKAIVDRLSSALSVGVGTDPGTPGVEVGDDDEAQASENTTSVHTDVDHTLRIRAFSETEAKTTSRDAAEALTGRDNPPRLEDPFTILDAQLTGSAMDRTRRTQGPDIYTDILIVTYRVTRS